MKKFPVVSPVTGREYLVKIKRVNSSIFSEMYNVDIFRKVKFFRWEFSEQVNDIFANWYDGEKWEYDLIAMALREIEKVEEEEMLEERNELRREVGEKAFMEWDGGVTGEES